MIYALILKATNEIIGIANRDYPKWTYNQVNKLRVVEVPLSIERPFELLGEDASILKGE